MPMINIDGSSMFFVDWGSGKPVVLLHGYLGNASMWSSQLVELEQHYRVIVPELWGHGNSDPLPAEVRDLHALVRHIEQLLDALTIEKCVLVGQSIGGMLAAELALILPHRVAGLVLMNTYLGDEPSNAKSRIMAMIDQAEADNGFSDELIDQIEPMFFLQDENESTIKARHVFRKELASMDSARLSGSIIPIGRMIFNRPDLRRRLPELMGIPALVMCGEYDVVRPPSESMEMAELLGCPYVEVSGAGHSASVERPDFVTHALIDFIDRSLRAA